MQRIYINALKCKMLAWRKRGNPWDRYVQNTSNVNDKISNSKEEKTSISMSIGKLHGGTTESHGGNPQTASSYSTSQWHTSWNSWQPTSSEKWWWFRFAGTKSRKSTGSVDKTPTHNAHLCSTLCSQARNGSHALGSRASKAQVTRIALSSLCAWKESCHLVCNMSHPLLFSHLPFTTSTSSSSFTLPSTTTQEHAAQSVNHDQLQEHPAEWRKAAHDSSHRLRTQKSFRPSRERKIILEMHINYKMYRKNRRRRSPSSDHRRSEGIWRELACQILKYQRCPTSKRRCISTIPWKALQTLISKMESYKMLTSPLYAQKALGKPDAMVMQVREVSAQNTQADRKDSLRSHSSEGQKALGKPNALFSSEQGNLIRSSVFRNADPSNLRGSLLEGNKDHLLNQARSDLAQQELHVRSLNKCIGELQRQTEEQRLAPQDAQYGFVESRGEQVRQSARTSSGGSLSAKVERKSRDDSTAHFPIAANARTDDLHDWFRCFKKWNRITVEDCLTFPVNLRWFRVLVPCSAATQGSRLTHGIYLDYRKTFWEINFLRMIHPEIILKEFNLTTCKGTEKQSPKKDESCSDKWRQTKSWHYSNADICDTAADHEFHNAGGITVELHGRTARTANVGIAIRQNSLIHNRF